MRRTGRRLGRGRLQNGVARSRSGRSHSIVAEIASALKNYRGASRAWPGAHQPRESDAPAASRRRACRPRQRRTENAALPAHRRRGPSARAPSRGSRPAGRSRFRRGSRRSRCGPSQRDVTRPRCGNRRPFTIHDLPHAAQNAVPTRRRAEHLAHSPTTSRPSLRSGDRCGRGDRRTGTRSLRTRRRGMR
jgi:hypothetical protein